MHAIVLGAGVVGVTTAYFLAERGCRVTVIDRDTDVGNGTSRANGGQLSYSFTDSLARPEFIPRIPALLAGRDRTSRIRVSPKLIPWGSRFLLQCTSERSRANTMALLDMAMRSAQLMPELCDKITRNFSFRRAGKLVLMTDPDDLRAAEQSTKRKQDHGCSVELVSRADALAVEPALATFDEPFEAAVYSKDDEVADTHEFVVGLRNYLESTHDVRFHLGTAINRLIRSNGRVTGVAGEDVLYADLVVVCLGPWSSELLRSAGLKTSIFPVRGYSVTLPVGTDSPSVSITSLKNRFVFSRLNGNMRIAGFADFNGFDTRNDADRIETLVDTARQVAPGAADYQCEQQQAWGGFRPMTPSGQPLVGRTTVDGLYVNTGHGMLGLTLAAASGEAVSRSILGDS